MKETITNKEMWDYIHQYYGYGCVDAPVYLIGQEEGGGNIDYRYDRFINAVSDKTCIDIDNPIDKNNKIRTLDGSAFHKQIKLLEQKDSLAENIVRKIFEDKKVKVDKDIIVSYIPDKIFVDRQIDHNNRDERRQLNSEIIKAKNDLSALLNSKVQELLTNKQISTITSDYIPTRFIHLKEWLYSGNIETEMTQSTFTPIVTHIISPLYERLYKTSFKEKEFQATQMARINSKYPLFLSELYPIACKDLETWDIKKFCPTFADKDRYRSNIAKNRALCIKKLIQTVKVPPKVVIMYGGIGDDNFDPFWNEIASCNNADWGKPITFNQNDYYIRDNGTTIFVKTPHPLSHTKGKPSISAKINDISYAFFDAVYSSIVDYSKDHHIPLSISLS